ncbi:Transducin beta-like protein 3 [Orchesella cincta]|uniref:Transducin beta-like protein 3 n=1 Tax=Orchesella cincta TaxID=48709 RepID=A0A1D2NCB3_ORCCI|nr:Transducin beta-like protein 3 [Orchesella cincta]
MSVLSHCHFACQSGASINVISTSAAIKPKSDPDDDDATIINGDEAEIEHMAVDGSTQITGCFQIISHLESELDEITAFDACPATHLLVTSHKSTLLRVWDLNKNEVIKTIKSLHTLPIVLLELHKARANFSLRKKLKASSTSDSEPEAVVQVPSFEEATLSTRNDLIWTTVSGALVKVWEFGGNQMSKAIHVPNIASIGFVKWDDSGKKSRLFVAERNIYIIQPKEGGGGNVSNYGITNTLEGHYSQVTGIEFVEGNVMISGGRDKVLILWDMQNAFARLKTIPLPESIESTVLLSPIDLYIALSPSDIRHYNVKKNSLSKSSMLQQGVDEPIVGFYPSPLSQETGDRDSFFAATHSSVLFHIEEVSSKSRKLKISKQYVGCLDEVLCIVYWEGDKIAVANNTNIIKVYDLATGQCEFLRGHKDIVLSLATQKKWLVSASKDNSIMLWTTDSDQPQVVLEGHLASVTAVCFSPVEFLLYSVSEDNFLKKWDLKKCLKSQLAHDKEIHSAHCSPNGQLVITSSRDKTAKIWDTESLGLAGTLKGHKKSVWDAKFSSWDQLAVTASADTTIKVWNVVSFACIQTLQGHLSSVLQVEFCNLGLQIVSTSSDGTFRVWDLKSSSCVSTEECGNDKIWTLAAKPDASEIITGSADSIITVWEDITEQKVKENLAKRKKTIEEEQKLNNVLKSGAWKEAFKLAIELDRPFTLLKIIRELKDPSELAPIVESLTLDLKSQMIDYIKKWNTNTKTSTEAQYLLNTLFRTTDFENLESMPTEALLAYTEKHNSRLKTHRQHVAVIQYFANKDELMGS